MNRSILALVAVAPFLMAADIESAQGLLVQGDFQGAKQEFAEITRTTPSLPAGWIGLARAHAGMGQCSEAVAILAEWRHANGYNARAATTEAWCHFREGDFAQAYEAAEDARLLKPNLGPALYLRARAESALGESDAFDDTLAELHPTPRGDVLTALARGWDAVERGDEVALIEVLDEMSHLQVAYPGSGVGVQAALMDAQRMLDVGDAYGAEQLLASLEGGEAEQVHVVLLRAEALRRLGRTGAARMLLSQPHIRTRTSAAPRSVRARVLVDLGLTDAVLERLDDLTRSSHPDDIASGWYVARATGDEALMSELSVRWNAMNLNPDRSLMDLVPEPIEAL